MGFELKLLELPDGVDVAEGPDLTAPPEPPRAEMVLLQEGSRVGEGFGLLLDRASIESALASYKGGCPWIERLETRAVDGKLWLFALLKPGVSPAGEPAVRLSFTTAPRLVE